MKFSLNILFGGYFGEYKKTFVLQKPVCININKKKADSAKEINLFGVSTLILLIKLFQKTTRL